MMNWSFTCSFVLQYFLVVPEVGFSNFLESLLVARQQVLTKKQFNTQTAIRRLFS